jgi:hypothetical protein
MRYIAFFCATITVFVVNSVVFGIDLLVPSQYANIQAAIDDANNGDAVIVADGTYTGSGNYNIDFKAKAITVTSQNGPENCIIDCQNSSGRRGFKFISGEDPNSILSGFTIKRGKIYSSSGDAHGGGIYCTGSSPTIENCIITDNKIRGEGDGWPYGGFAYGGGLYCQSNSNPQIIGCTISNNLAQGGDGHIGFMSEPAGAGGWAWGGGIYCSSNSTVIILDSDISGNKAWGGTGGAAGSMGGSDAPGGDALGGGICCEGTADINNCLIRNNLSEGGTSIGTGGNGSGYGSGTYTTSNATIKNCTVVNNTPKGIQRDGGTLTITDCIVYGNGDDLLGCSATYSCIEDGDAGVGNIAGDPCFVAGPDGNYYLSQIAAGQASDSPCVDTGSDTAVNLGMNEYTTRTDGLNDMGTVDMGYHYPVVFACPDIDENWNVDFGDFAIQANQWQQSDANGLAGDITMDGFVGLDDLDILADSWLDCYVTTASFLSPADNASGVDPNTDLSWSAGDGAVYHDIYFGTDANAVADANHSSAEFMTTDANTTLDPGPLDINSTYCWRIDEVGPRCTAKGNVWTFTTWTEPNLLSLWKFDEGEGTTAYDSAGNNDGTIYGAQWTTGQIGGALQFDGVDDYVQVADQPIFDTGDKLTVAHWFKTTTNQVQKGMVTHDSSDYKYMTYLTSNSGMIQFYIRQSSGVVSTSTGDLGTGYWADDQWHLVVGIFDRSLPSARLKLYVDGVLKDSKDGSDQSIIAGDEGIVIGRWKSGNEFAGAIDDVRIYDRALSAGEVQQLYQAGQ